VSSDEPFVVTVEHDLDQAWPRAAETLKHEARIAATYAADDGVRAMQDRHPYQDRTGMLSGDQHTYEVPPQFVSGDGDVFETEIVVNQPYASFVDKGTVHAKAHPFTPIAERAAKSTAEREAREAVQRFERGCKGD
jgi:hypothetical protein